MLFRFLNWSSRFAIRELLLGTVLPWTFLLFIVPYSQCPVVEAFFTILGMVALLLAFVLPFNAREWRAAFEKSFAEGRRIAPWHMRTFTVYSLVMLSMVLAMLEFDMAALGLALLTVEDAAFFSWITVFRNGRPDIPTAV